MSTTTALTREPEAGQLAEPVNTPAPVRRPGGRERRVKPTLPDKISLAALGLFAAVFSLWNLNGAPSYQEDEGTYTAQAFSVLEGELAPYTYWYDHPPLGWIQLGALAWIPQALGLGDGTYIGATRYVIPLFFVSTALLLFLLARRLKIRLPVAILIVVIFVLSPLSLVLGRQIYLDNIGMPWLLLAIYLALSNRRALWHHVGAGICFAIAVLSKETLAVFGPALLLAMMNRPTWTNRVFSVVGFLSVGGLILAFYPLVALLRGELVSGPDHVSLQDALVYQLLSRSGSGSIWEAGSDRAELLTGWLYYDKYLIAAGLAGAALCLLKRQTIWISVALASFALPVVIGEGYLPAMYIVGALPFLTLALGAALNILWDGLEKAIRPWRGKGRMLARGAAVTTVSIGLVLMSIPQWFEQDLGMLTGQENQEWKAALNWAQQNIPRDETVLAPYSMWQDLNAGRWEDPWAVVVTEKMDLDSQFLIEHPEGAAAIDWIIVGPIVVSNIKSLGLDRAGKVLEHSEPVKTFGEWSVHRVEDVPPLNASSRRNNNQ